MVLEPITLLGEKRTSGMDPKRFLPGKEKGEKGIYKVNNK